VDARGGRATSDVTEIENGQEFDRQETEAYRYRDKQATVGSEGKDEMAHEPQLPRFLVRRDARRGWMVWDRQAKSPAKYQGHMVVGLPEEQARKIKNELTKLYIEKG
jgi:hypothetical protein